MNCVYKLFSPNIAVQDNVWYNFYSRNITSWTGGQNQCRNDGGQLVTLGTERKWKFIKEEIQKLSNPADNEWFIGLTCKTGYRKIQNWQWITGEPLIKPHWQINQPSGDGQCVVIAKEYPPGTYGKYNDLSCQSLKGFICEINATSGNRIMIGDVALVAILNNLLLELRIIALGLSIYREGMQLDMEILHHQCFAVLLSVALPLLLYVTK